MSWYKRAMPLIRDVSPYVEDVCKQIKAIDGVTGVYVWGSFVDRAKTPNFPIKDIDIVATTNFDSGDFMAIDNSKYSAIRIKTSELENEGFNPDVVAFTKHFLQFEQYNVDHWATSKDKTLLHWGALPDSTDDWQELHADAEKRAQELTGMSRDRLHKADDEKRKDWKRAYNHYVSMFLNDKSAGWCPSQHKWTELMPRARKMA
jgi:hypothetical protein